MHCDREASGGRERREGSYGSRASRKLNGPPRQPSQPQRGSGGSTERLSINPVVETGDVVEFKGKTLLTQNVGRGWMEVGHRFPTRQTTPIPSSPGDYRTTTPICSNHSTTSPGCLPRHSHLWYGCAVWRTWRMASRPRNRRFPPGRGKRGSSLWVSRVALPRYSEVHCSERNR